MHEVGKSLGIISHQRKGGAAIQLRFARGWSEGAERAGERARATARTASAAAGAPSKLGMRWWTGRGSRATPSASSASHTRFRIAHFQARGFASAAAALAVDSIPARAAASRRSRSASKAAASNEAEDDEEEELLAADATAAVARRAAGHSGSGGVAGKTSGIAGWLVRTLATRAPGKGATDSGRYGSSRQADMWVRMSCPRKCNVVRNGFLYLYRLEKKLKANIKRIFCRLLFLKKFTFDLIKPKPLILSF